MSEVMERVKKVTAEVLKIELTKVKDDSRFIEDLGAESVQSIELVAAYEEEFDIEMDEDQALGVKTVNDATGFISKLI